MRREMGMLLVSLGISLVFFSLIETSTEEGSVGGVILIGPIPIIFGSSPEMAISSIILAILLIALSLILFRRQIR